MMKMVTILLFLGLSAFANEARSMTAYDLMSRFNPTFAKKMPAGEKKIQLTQIFAKGKTLSFFYSGVYLRFDYVGKKNNFIKLNGVAFSKKEVTQTNTLKKLVVTRFGLKLKNQSAFLFDNGRTFASETTVSPLGGEAFYPVTDPEVPSETWGGVQAVQEPATDNTELGGVNFNGAFESDEICLFCDAQEASTNTIRSRRQRMELAYEMITGDEQQAMLNFIGGWMGGLNSMLANNTAMNTFMTSGSQSPNSIEMPRHY